MVRCRNGKYGKSCRARFQILHKICIYIHCIRAINKIGQNRVSTNLQLLDIICTIAFHSPCAIICVKNSNFLIARIRSDPPIGILPSIPYHPFNIPLWDRYIHAPVIGIHQKCYGLSGIPFAITPLPLNVKT